MLQFSIVAVEFQEVIVLLGFDISQTVRDGGENNFFPLRKAKANTTDQRLYVLSIHHIFRFQLVRVLC